MSESARTARLGPAEVHRKSLITAHEEVLEQGVSADELDVRDRDKARPRRASGPPRPAVLPLTEEAMDEAALPPETNPPD